MGISSSSMGNSSNASAAMLEENRFMENSSDDETSDVALQGDTSSRSSRSSSSDSNNNSSNDSNSPQYNENSSNERSSSARVPSSDESAADALTVTPLRIRRAAPSVAQSINVNGNVWDAEDVLSLRCVRAQYGGNAGQPVDSINLSDSEDNSSPPRSRPPVAYIDLCTPEMPRRCLTTTCDEPLSVEQAGACGTSNDNNNNNNKISRVDNTYKCPVCLDSINGREPTSTCCGHVFCNKCIADAVRITKKCPLCNEKLTMRRIFRIYI